MKSFHQMDGLYNYDQRPFTTPLNMRDEALRVKVTNEYKEDCHHDQVSGRTTAVTFAYTSSIANAFSSVMPGLAAGEFTVVPPNTVGTTSETVQIRSTSTSDAAAGSGVASYLIYFLDLSYTIQTLVVSVTGTTANTVTFPSGLQAIHFIYGFPITRGSVALSHPGVIASNVGSIYLGSGGISGSSFTKNYMWNRAGDGFITSGIYCVPANCVGAISSIKLNTDASATVTYRVFYRLGRQAPWILISEDTVNSTTVIEEAFSGGFLPTGTEYTVVAQRNTGTNIAANFIMTHHQIRVDCFSAKSF